MTITQADINTLWTDLCARVAGGDRFAGLFATGPQDGTLVVSAHVATTGGIDTLDAPLPRGAEGYPALTPRLGAAFWYEREIHDHFGVVPQGPSQAGVADPPRLTGGPRAAPARGGLRDLHDPTRPGPLGRFRVDGVPCRDPARGEPAP